MPQKPPMPAAHPEPQAPLTREALGAILARHGVTLARDEQEAALASATALQARAARLADPKARGDD
ncbi:hypothetical protein AQS8620_02932 [Aquimixticola soesokkakensis]|uniref:Uncharacterized protein n=1 Tax=Aquimixticola soesokkakensis TaxID=1519096 RepID=A0A1Y5THF9_9RHOB|nr:hypothetical protein [Aquimixticola soesokkakensis]SLN63891.1 hypothetical protein AQS8620_02932 [Aquimixticola soesokkakensis]